MIVRQDSGVRFDDPFIFRLNGQQKTLTMNNADKPAHPSGIYTGLSKRELIAAMMAQGMLANNWLEYSDVDPDCTLLAKAATNYADALIEELQKSI